MIEHVIFERSVELFFGVLQVKTFQCKDTTER